MVDKDGTYPGDRLPGKTHLATIKEFLSDYRESDSDDDVPDEGKVSSFSVRNRHQETLSRIMSRIIAGYAVFLFPSSVANPLIDMLMRVHRQVMVPGSDHRRCS